MIRKLSGIKTYIAAAGLFGLALYQASQRDFQTAAETALAALSVLGIRHAVAKSA